MAFNPEKPFNELPPIPPLIELENKTILKKCIGARSLLAELKQVGRLIPNQSVLINTIPLLEAQKSSEIENIVTTTDKLFEYSAIEDQADPHTKETLRYRTALKQGFEKIKNHPITTRMAEEICTTLRNIDMTIRKVPGTKLENPSTQQIIYTPPEGESVLRDKLANWEKFINMEENLDPLIVMAIMHYQFEAIHPFTDGNGRTGRILNILYLIQKEILEIPVLFLSRFIIQNKNDYYKGLLNVTKNQHWQNWIEYMLEAVIQTAKWTKEKIESIKMLMDHTQILIQTKLPKIYSRELVELIFVQPYARIQNVIDLNLAKRQTASTYLKALAEINVLNEIKRGRDKIYINPKFIQLLVGNKN